MMNRTTFLFLLTVVNITDGFAPFSIRQQQKQQGFTTTIGLASNSNDDGISTTTKREEAESLLAKARQLRSELETTSVDETSTLASGGDATTTKAKIATSQPPLSKWSVQPSDDDDSEGPGYRLYIDIGREDGTWMEPRWGASGNRIEFSLDVEFSKAPANEVQADKLVSDNMFGQKSSPYVLKTASVARLRQGFDSMKCIPINNDDDDDDDENKGDGKKDGAATDGSSGAYRVDTKGNQHTVRFYVNAEGKEDPSYGDVTIPSGGLYFSLPCFGGTVSQLSSKEGIVTVRQMGWNTGWRREESRIVGVFHAKPIEEARRKDGF